ncbi:WD repeat-containing protein 41 [Spea bombifrons]|uniref:WD repeat-containing protein 41 n=1 Tax=Spea bombifrons TaxID=233779 RepID=UPI002349BFCA|nr:WD repeat-containing protein 41 [Spea bombifrons]
MLRWLLGSREPQGGVEKSPVLNIGEEQAQNPYTELTPLQAHNDIVRFLVQIDDLRFASAGDDGSVYVWDVQTGEILLELHGHTQKITALAVFQAPELPEGMSNLILTASSDKTVIAWDCESGHQVQKASDFHSTVKSLLVLHSLDIWLSAGSELRVWSRDCKLLCETGCFVDGGISALIELPKNCVAAAIGKDLIIFKLGAVSEQLDQWDISEVKCLSGHQDNIRALITINESIFASGSDAGELIVWDSSAWTVHAFERNISSTSSPEDSPQEVKLLPLQEEISVQHLSSDGEIIFAAVGSGIYVYNIQVKRVIAFQKRAHDSNIQHIANLPNRQLISCSEDGSVRIWELRSKQQLHAEAVPSGFFSMWGFGKAGKQVNHAVKKIPENGIVASLELIGDLIGHSSSVQMFLYFTDHGLVTCSADQLIIIWKEGIRESRLRSLLLFQKLDQNGDLQPRFTLS